jgi:hypothetical protein
MRLRTKVASYRDAILPHEYDQGGGPRCASSQASWIPVSSAPRVLAHRSRLGLPARQADLRALVQFAKRVSSSTTAARLLGVTSHGYFPPEELGALGDATIDSFAPMAEMTLRWSSQFLSHLRTACTTSTRRLLAI